MNIYVGNLSYDTTEESMRAAFEQFGAVDSARVIMDRMSGRPRGFGFVEMADSGEAQAAIDGLNGTQLDGRAINFAEPRRAMMRERPSHFELNFLRHAARPRREQANFLH